MSRSNSTRTGALAAATAILALAGTCGAYIDLAPTLAKVIGDSKKIAVVEVAAFSPASRVIVLKELRALKGELSPEPVRQRLAPPDGAISRQVLQWAEPAARGVLFVSGRSALVCVGQGWYQVAEAGNGVWTWTAERPDLPLAYYGPVVRLAEAVQAMLAGKDAVLTVVAYGANDEGASFDLALNRQNLPALVKVQRIRANLRMPPMVMAASANPAYLIGPGAVDEADAPALRRRLKSADPVARAEAADELGYLGPAASQAAGDLAALLDDASPRARVSAAAALLRITPNSPDRPLKVLREVMAGPQATDRRDAARAAGLGGPAAVPLAGKLAALLLDADEPTRRAALEAISTLGPAAAKACDAVAELLDEPAWAVDAADALGRLGAAARPVLKRLAGMLDANQPAVRWAAVRAMAQIGGPDAGPAVDFMIRALPRASEVEGYNMMIYLALLGPTAADAADAIRSARIKNPVLPSATLWALRPDKSFPWLREGDFGRRGPGGPGGPGGFGPPMGEGPDFAVYIYECYVRELGERLAPAAVALAGRIRDGSAGNVPAWGYEILTCAPAQVLAVLTPRLADRDILQRERAAVALGYMGPAAQAAEPPLRRALAAAPTEREQRLLKWSLRQLARR